MKKILLCSLLLVLALGALCVFYIVPKTFHETIHQELIAKQWPGNHVKFEKGSMNESESLVTLSPTTHLKVRTVSFLNPLSNYINVDYVDTKEQLDINFQVYAHLNGLSSLKLEAKFSDEHITHKNNHLEVKNLSIFIENFTPRDLVAISGENSNALLADKRISLKVEKLILKSGTSTNSLEGIDLTLGSNIDNENLDFDFSTEIKKLVNENLEEKLGLTTASIHLTLSSFEKNMALQFLSTIPQKSIISRSPPSIFEVLPYFQSIRYPLEFKLRAQAEDNSGSMVGLTLDLALKEQTFLTLASYSGALEFNNKKIHTTAMLKEIILFTFPKSTARFYSLSEDAAPDKRFLERDQVEKIIEAALREDMESRDDKILRAALDLEIITLNENLYTSNLALEDGKFNLNSKQYSFNELKRLPMEMILKIYPHEIKFIPNLLKSKGLFLVPSM